MIKKSERYVEKHNVLANKKSRILSQVLRNSNSFKRRKGWVFNTGASIFVWCNNTNELDSPYLVIMLYVG